MSRARVAQAFQAMKDIGISSKAVKPVLKNLLQLYDNNWELIEEENYRALADAIFEYEDSKEQEARNTTHEKTDREDMDKEAFGNGDLSPPRTRQRSRQEADHSSPSVSNPGIVIGEPYSKRRKMDEAISPQITCSQEESGPISSQTVGKGKRPVVVSPLTCTSEKRTETVSLQASSGDKRSQPLLPQIPLREKTLVQERIPNTTCLKEPKVEPGIGLLPKGSQSTDHHSGVLVKPKCEPFTGDEVPISVIHPQRPHTRMNEDQISNEGPFANSSSGQADVPDAFASQHAAVRAGEEDSVQHTACRNGANLELVSISEAPTANFEIASSASGEVKLSLTCNSDRLGFHTPSLDEVLKLVEDKCLRSYKILEPTFSVAKLMQEICQCFLELGTDSSDDKRDKPVNITPTIDFLKKPDLHNVLGAKCHPFQGNFNQWGSSNGSSNSHSSPELMDPQVPRLLGFNGLQGCCTQPNQGDSRDGETEKDMKKNAECSESPNLNSQSLVPVQQHQFSFGDVRPLHDVNDIAKGEEKVRISLVNEVSSVLYPPSFYYIPQNIVYQNAYVNFSLARIGDEDCCSDCFGDCLSSSIPCACARETGGEYAYTLDGRIKKQFLDECISMNRDPQKHRHFYCKDCPLERSKNEDQPDQCKGHLVRKFIKECWSKCGCSKQCGNRVVQRGITCNLQVFFTSEGKGWGLRTLEELPKGAFVCEYVGEVITNTELYNRNMQGTGNEKHHYPVLLDADWGSEGVLKDEEALCLDATFYGNVARFINHRCFDANLVEIPVEVETPDHHYYHLAFFTTRKVEALDELTWDYGIDFDDDSHPVKAFRCHCGSKYCRDMKRSTRAKSTALAQR
ncbi:hypothetical protein MRB53_035599 [Persea americana]|uniref:Uncharacterized protein n=1 Tax=Persea americana TaxID=3435 RepID=A0ACC2K529_PERAE|nr:hypothetical protein MRB53_035599 [Persea americana]